ncbi:hypothetical protein CERZMDRAFT_82328 [Cercospora zeae-maydis SCOH1-5]|uniref:Secreted protein n=1 Tax=Cercospora zeae-maydis SCOH1-5 TaxID=717836 RepID=A0A6A6FPA3_9PEZI|nr:hypothetical protein CERZMDRAFT_82328 [Cercospora zeae-maydis SCOH1-5]
MWRCAASLLGMRLLCMPGLPATVCTQRAVLWPVHFVPETAGVRLMRLNATARWKFHGHSFWKQPLRHDTTSSESLESAWTVRRRKNQRKDTAPRSVPKKTQAARDLDTGLDEKLRTYTPLMGNSTYSAGEAASSQERHVEWPWDGGTAAFTLLTGSYLQFHTTLGFSHH